MMKLPKYHTPFSYKTQGSFRVFTKCTPTCNGRQTEQIQYKQLTAVIYHHAYASISYTVAKIDFQFFQMYASVNTNTIINLIHSHTQTLALHVQDRPLHLDMSMLTYCTLLQFLSTLHHRDPRMSGPTSPWNSWKVDEEMWTMLGESNCDPHRDAKMSVHAVTRSLQAILCLSSPNNRISPVPAACNTSVT